MKGALYSLFKLLFLITWTIHSSVMIFAAGNIQEDKHSHETGEHSHGPTFKKLNNIIHVNKSKNLINNNLYHHDNVNNDLNHYSYSIINEHSHEEDTKLNHSHNESYINTLIIIDSFLNNNLLVDTDVINDVNHTGHENSEIECCIDEDIIYLANKVTLLEKEFEEFKFKYNIDIISLNTFSFSSKIILKITSPPIIIKPIFSYKNLTKIIKSNI